MSVQVAGTGVKAWPSPRHRWSAGFTRRAVATRSGTPSRLTSRTRGPKRHSASGPSVRAFAKGGSHEADATRLRPPTTRPRDASHPRPRGHQPLFTVWAIPPPRLSLRIGEILGARTFILYHTTTWTALIKRTDTVGEPGSA